MLCKPFHIKYQVPAISKHVPTTSIATNI